jgi:hypothetical protein
MNRIQSAQLELAFASGSLYFYTSANGNTAKIGDRSLVFARSATVMPQKPIFPSSQHYNMTAGILSLPKLTNGFSRFVKPFTICKQVHQFHGAEKLYRVRVWAVQWPRFPSGKIRAVLLICKSLLKD